MNPLENRKRVAIFEYDFAKDGGAVGNITMRGGDLPSGAIVTSGLVDVITQPTSGGSATVALKAVGTADLLAATAIASITGVLDTVPDGTAAKMVKCTARKVPVMTIAVAALTAGKFRMALEYVVTQ